MCIGILNLFLIAGMFGQWGVSTMKVLSCLRPYSWRLLPLLPVLKQTAFTDNNVEWQRYRRLRLDLYHRCMDQFIDEIYQKVGLGHAFGTC